MIDTIISEHWFASEHFLIVSNTAVCLGSQMHLASCLKSCRGGAVTDNSCGIYCAKYFTIPRSLCNRFLSSGGGIFAMASSLDMPGINLLLHDCHVQNWRNLVLDLLSITFFTFFSLTLSITCLTIASCSSSVVAAMMIAGDISAIEIWLIDWFDWLIDDILHNRLLWISLGLTGCFGAVNRIPGMQGAIWWHATRWKQVQKYPQVSNN